MSRAPTSRRLPSPSPPPLAPEASFSFSNDRHPAPRKQNGKRSLFESNLSHDQVEHLRRQSSLSTLSLSPRRPSLAGSGSTATQRPARGATGLAFGHQDDTTSYLSEHADETPWTMIDRMRNWRNDAMTQHLYDSAKFWGSKVLGLTENPDDAFWLAQIHFLTSQYAQAERILTALRPIPSTTASTSTAASAVRLTDSSLACRYLAAQCQVRLGKWEEALEMVGRRGNLLSESEGDKGDGGIKLTASAAHLRGLIYMHMKATDLAKEAFMEALSRDVKCFESYEMLVGSEMMSSEEEWDFIQSLPYHSQAQEDAEFIRMMYTVRLKKLAHNRDIAVARKRLKEDYALGNDPDVLFSLADEMYNGMRYAECFKVTSKILSRYPSHRPTLPIHLACMQQLPNMRSRLFLLAHEMVDSEPDDAVSWYAVGLWYFAGKRWEESRRFFGKSVLIDPRFGPAWLAYAHSFAFEGEHDQAITAYSTAHRHLSGSHLPVMFIGMQHLGLGNATLAEEYLLAAREICKDDPLVLNELGVVCVHNGEYERAIQFFRETLSLVQTVQSSQAAWSTTHLNLGHAYRKLGRFSEAQASYRKVLDLDPRSAAAYSALGLVEHQRGNFQDSITRYHEALALAPGEPVTCDLLKVVLDDVSSRISDKPLLFPGLPRRVLHDIDRQVAELDAEIRVGLDTATSSRARFEDPNKHDRSGVENSMALQTRSEEGIEMSLEEVDEDEDGSEGETMDITGD
ncbi:anaphase promoting complex subunit CDC16 [Sporobolomyces koalae]|uniref:anaphase promoting complex subunit CDC16 n=1 Tax=Sporobolomyces koalae TaxID=500713 RepID=UPI003175E4C5